jgi:ribosome-associated protein
VTDSRSLALLAAQASSAKQGEGILILDVRELISITDYFVIVSGNSDRQVKAVAEEVEKSLKDAGVRPVRVEGEPETGWVLLDFVDFVVHVFREAERDYYRLENLWGDARVVDWEQEAKVSSS